MLDFLSLKTEAFGLEINDLNLRFLKLKEKKGKFTCASIGEAAIAPGVVVNGEVKNAKALSETIKAALKKARGERIGAKYVVASLPEDKAFLQVIQMPKIGLDDLKGAVNIEAENFVPMPLEKVCLDFQVIPEKTPLDHCDILTAAFPRDTVDGYVAAIAGAGLKALALELESQAVARALVGDFSDSPVMIIQVGEVRTNVIICAGYSLRFSFSLPASDSDFIEIISKDLGVDKITARDLKIKYGIEKFGLPASEKKDERKPKTKDKKTDAEQRKIFEALVAELNEFAQRIGKCIEYYHNHARHEHLPKDKRTISKIILCGVGANLKGLDKFLALKFGLPVEVAKPPACFRLKKEPKALLTEENAGAYAAALGLAIRAHAHKEED